MAVRQYIGARYVPKFADPVEWSSQMTYEPLTIVTYMFGSYTSIKAVPAGVVPTNTEYWAPTGNYNAQVEAYRQEVVDVSEKVDSILERDNHYYLLVGDSYANPNYPGWASILVERLNLTENDYTLVYQGGYSYTGDQFLSLVENLAVETRNKVTDMIIISAGNDMAVGDQNTVPLAVKKFYSTIGSLLPNCRRFMSGVTPYRRVHQDPVRAANIVNWVRNYQLPGQEFMPFSPSWSKLNSEILEDGTHLTEDGYERIARGIERYIRGGATIPAHSLAYQIAGTMVLETIVESNMLTIYLSGNATFNNSSSAEVYTITTSSQTYLRGGNYTLRGVFLYGGDGCHYAQLRANNSTISIVSNETLNGNFSIGGTITVPVTMMC